MNIVIDTNVIVAALIRRGAVRELLLQNPGIFMTPEPGIEEAWENRASWNRRRVPDEEILDLLDWMVREVLLVMPRSMYAEREPDAASLIADADDIPVVALALSVENEGIWTFNTKDFSRSDLILRARVLTTGTVRSLLSRRDRPLA